MKNLITLSFLTLASTMATAQEGAMSFFVTSQNPGQGGNLGGLEGADAYCGQLAEAAGVTSKTWRAYLSTSGTDARDRIGDGPWRNANGALIAENLAALHGEGNAIDKETALDETGNIVNGRGDEPNRHDILTGSMPDGTAAEQTCDDWTSGGEGSAMVGHHDRMGLEDTPAARSWNSSHPSQGCDLAALQGTGGDGLFYCFAVD